MKDFELIKNLVGSSVREEDLSFVDCYVHEKAGLFIPSAGPCLYAQKEGHTHPSYMVAIYFSLEELEIQPTIEVRKDQYYASVLSPDVPHSDVGEGMNYYCVLIDRDYFEEQYRLYEAEIPCFRWKEFAICHDILKALNTFAFEYSKEMPNSDITLDAQATIITHWIIRSILGEEMDMRPVPSDFEVARAEQYIERHFSENITVRKLADIVSMSESGFNRSFKRETGMTPIEYLIRVRLEKSKLLLRRKEIPITEIALRCGFKSSAYFSTSFTRLMKITPKEYRNSYKD